LIHHSFFSRLSKIDKKCILIDFFKDYFANNCAVDKIQYEKGSCKHADHSCDFINDLIGENEIFDFYYDYPGELDIKKVCSFDEKKRKGDWVDVKALALANKNGAVMVLSCDARLLQLCKDIGVRHYCFKASLVKLCNTIKDNEIFLGGEFNTSLMFNKQITDPFLSYYKNSKCKKCSGKKGCGNKLSDLNASGEVIKRNSNP